MVDEIAVLTTSGKAYYRLVNELKKQKIKFLSLKPNDAVPAYIKVIITTEESNRFYNGIKKKLVFDEQDDPAKIVEESVRILKGKEKYNTVVIGVDPGKRFGIAIIGDGTIIKTRTFSNVEKTTQIITQWLKETKANKKVVKIGDGAEKYRYELQKLLDKTLPKNTVLESVKENSTTKLNYTGIKRRRGLRDEIAALKISAREGQTIKRENNEKID